MIQHAVIIEPQFAPRGSEKTVTPDFKCQFNPAGIADEIRGVRRFVQQSPGLNFVGHIIRAGRLPGGGHPGKVP